MGEIDITGVMITTLSPALEILRSLVPLDVWIIKEALVTYLRIRDEAVWGRIQITYGHMQADLATSRRRRGSHFIAEGKQSIRANRFPKRTHPHKYPR